MFKTIPNINTDTIEVGFFPTISYIVFFEEIVIDHLTIPYQKANITRLMRLTLFYIHLKHQKWEQISQTNQSEKEPNHLPSFIKNAKKIFYTAGLQFNKQSLILFFFTLIHPVQT